VEHSAARYLPGLDFPQLLLELNIELYYAREFRVADPHDYTAMKMAAMSEAINMAYAHSPPNSQCLNVISIGDSCIERTALRQLLSMWSASGCLAFKPMQKTLKLLEDPEVQTLTAELSELVPCFAGIHAHSGDLDLIAADLEHIQTGLLQGFSPGSTVSGETSMVNMIEVTV
jgi:hypothetical protein